MQFFGNLSRLKNKLVYGAKYDNLFVQEKITSQMRAHQTVDIVGEQSELPRVAEESR